MATAIEIANMALGHVGDRVITSFTEENERARNATLYFAEARRTSLRLGSWNCCSKRATLPADATAPSWGYTKRYLLPGDFIRLIAVKNAVRGFKFEIEDGYLLTDLSAPLSIKYVFDDSDVQGFDPLLTRMMTWVLAGDLVEPLSHSNTKKNVIDGELDKWMKRAQNADGQERQPQELQETSWISARSRTG